MPPDGGRKRSWHEPVVRAGERERRSPSEIKPPDGGKERGNVDAAKNDDRRL